MNTIEANNLQDKEIKVGNSTKIKYNTQVKNLSQKYVKTGLEEYFIFKVNKLVN